MDFDHSNDKHFAGGAHLDGIESNMPGSELTGGQSSASSKLQLNHFNSREFSATKLVYDNPGHGGERAHPVIYGTVAMAVVALRNYAIRLAPHLKGLVDQWTAKLKSFHRTSMTADEAKVAKEGIDKALTEELAPLLKEERHLRTMFEHFCNALKAEIDEAVAMYARTEGGRELIKSKLGRRL